MRRLIICIFALATGAVSGSLVAGATPLLNSDFEGDPLWLLPAGWTVGSYDGLETKAWVTNAAAGEGSQSFYLWDWAYPSQLSARYPLAPVPINSGVWFLNGMARVEQTDVQIEPFTLISGFNDRFNNLCFGSDGTFNYEDGHGNIVSTGVSYASGTWYKFDERIDMTNRRWGFRILDTMGGELCSRQNINFGTSYAGGFMTLRTFGASGSETGTWYVDGISLDTPEPGTAVLLGIGLGALALTRRRRPA